MTVSLSALRTGRALLPRIIILLLVVLIPVISPLTVSCYETSHSKDNSLQSYGHEILNTTNTAFHTGLHGVTSHIHGLENLKSHKYDIPTRLHGVTCRKTVISQLPPRELPSHQQSGQCVLTYRNTKCPLLAPGN
jgi:hypothetical protein